MEKGKVLKMCIKPRKARLAKFNPDSFKGEGVLALLKIDESREAGPTIFKCA